MVMRHPTCLYAPLDKRLLAATGRKNGNQCQYMSQHKAVQLDYQHRLRPTTGKHRVLEESSYESEPRTQTDQTD